MEWGKSMDCEGRKRKRIVGGGKEEKKGEDRLKGEERQEGGHRLSGEHWGGRSTVPGGYSLLKVPEEKM